MVGCSITGNSFNHKNIIIFFSLISVAAPISTKALLQARSRRSLIREEIIRQRRD